MINLSVIIPTHNRVNELTKLLYSLRKLENSEIIIVENNSSNINKIKYEKIINEFKKKLKIKYISKNIKSLPKARYEGIKLSSAKYIFQIDDDDMITKKMIKWLNHNLQKINKDIYRMPYLRKFGYIYRRLSPRKNFTLDPKSYFQTIEISTFLIKRSILKEKFFNIDFNMGEDIYIATWLKDFKQNFINVPSIKYNFFKTENSMTRNVDAEEWMLQIKNNISKTINDFKKSDRKSYLLKFLYLLKKSKRVSYNFLWKNFNENFKKVIMDNSEKLYPRKIKKINKKLMKIGLKNGFKIY